MPTCYVLDDELDAIEIIVSYIENIPELTLIGSSNQPSVAIKEIHDLRPDITFLDVDMPGFSGLEVADILKGKTNFIMTTGHSGYAVDAFEKKVSDFLLKPITFKKFLTSVNEIIFKIEENKKKGEKDDYFFIKPGIKGILIKISYQDVCFVEGLKNYIIIMTDKGKHITYLTMKEIESVLPSKNFIRIHKSYIVNIDYIKAIEGNLITIQNDTKLPLGPAYRANFYSRIDQNSVKSSR